MPKHRQLVRSASTVGDRTSRRLAREGTSASQVPRASGRASSLSSDTDLEVEGGSPPNADFVRHLLEEHSIRMSAQLDAGLLEARTQLQTVFAQNLSTTLSKLDVSYQRRFVGLERAVSEHDLRFERLHAELMEQQARICKLEEAIYKPFTKLEAELVDDDFNRPVDSLLLRGRTLSNVSIEAFQRSLEATIVAMAIPAEEVVVKGSSPGKSFEVTFHGSAVVQAARCKKFLALQKLPDRTYRKLVATDSAGAETPVFVETDKNRCTIKGELLTRKARKLLEAAAGRQLSVRKSDNAVFQGPEPVVRIRDVTPAAFRVEWNRDWREANPAVQADCLRELDELFADRAARASWG